MNSFSDGVNQLTWLPSAPRVDKTPKNKEKVRPGWTACALRRSDAADRLSGLSLQDDEINHQSQMVEKLKEQMLDQEEVDDLCFLSFHPFCLRRLQK